MGAEAVWGAAAGGCGTAGLGAAVMMLGRGLCGGGGGLATGDLAACADVDCEYSTTTEGAWSGGRTRLWPATARTRVRAASGRPRWRRRRRRRSEPLRAALDDILSGGLHCTALRCSTLRGVRRLADAVGRRRDVVAVVVAAATAEDTLGRATRDAASAQQSPMSSRIHVTSRRVV